MDAARRNLLAKLRAAVAGGPRLRLAVLFGSQATGKAVQGSDVDVGIVPVDERMPLGDELALASALSAATGTEVDVVRLDQAPPLLGREIALSGVGFFEEAPGLFAAWRAAAMSHWIDFDEMIGPHREGFLQRMRRGAGPRDGGRP